MNSHADARLVSILGDGCYTLRTMAFAISTGHQQIYRSVIPFIPRGTVLSHFYQSRADEDIAVLQGVDQQWSRCLMTLQGHRSVRAIAYSPTGAYVAATSTDGVIRLWSTATGSVTQVLRHDMALIDCVSFSSDETRVAASSYNQVIYVWDAADGRLIRRISHFSMVSQSAVAFSSKDNQVVFACGAWARTYDISSGKANKGIRTTAHTSYDDSVRSLAISGDWVATCSKTGMMVSDATTGTVITSVARSESLRDSITTVACSQKGKLILYGRMPSGTVHLQDLNTPGCDMSFKVGSVAALAICPDASKFAAATGEGLTSVIHIWTRGHSSPVLSLHSQHVMCMSFSSDGTRLATSLAMSGFPRIWDTVVGPTGSVVDADGATSEVQGVPVVALGSNTLHSQVVRCVDFSPDGCRIVSGSNDHTVRVWDTQTGNLVLLLPHTSAVFSAKFSPDGSQIAAGTKDSVPV